MFIAHNSKALTSSDRNLPFRVCLPPQQFSDRIPPPFYGARTMKTLIVTAALIFYLIAPSAWAQTRAKLHVVYPAISGINAPLWYATEQNLFQKYGLEVELIYIPTALQVTRVVLTGDSQIAFSGGLRS